MTYTYIYYTLTRPVVQVPGAQSIAYHKLLPILLYFVRVGEHVGIQMKDAITTEYNMTTTSKLSRWNI